MGTGSSVLQQRCWGAVLNAAKAQGSPGKCKDVLKKVTSLGRWLSRDKGGAEVLAMTSGQVQKIREPGIRWPESMTQGSLLLWEAAALEAEPTHLTLPFFGVTPNISWNFPAHSLNWPSWEREEISREPCVWMSQRCSGNEGPKSPRGGLSSEHTVPVNTSLQIVSKEWLRPHKGILKC